MTDTGWIIAGAGATTGSGFAWITPEYITAEDAQYAQVLDFTTFTTQYLKASSFGLSVPSDATIDGVEVRIQAETITDMTRLYMAVWSGDSTAGNDLETGPGTLTNVLTNYDYGGATEKWGLSLTPAIVNSSNFQVRFQAYNASGLDGMVVNAIWIKVHYTEDAGGTVETFKKGSAAHFIGV